VFLLSPRILISISSWNEATFLFAHTSLSILDVRMPPLSFLQNLTTPGMALQSYVLIIGLAAFGLKFWALPGSEQLSYVCPRTPPESFTSDPLLSLDP
jgi:hypothetical protein